MSGAAFKVWGDKKLLLKLTIMEKKVRGPIIRKALRAAAKIVKDKAKTNTPKSSGLLRKLIKIKTMKRKVGRMGIIVTLSINKSGIWYGNVVEWGRKKRAPFVGRGMIKKAYDETKVQAENIIRADIMNGILGVLK